MAILARRVQFRLADLSKIRISFRANLFVNAENIVWYHTKEHKIPFQNQPKALNLINCNRKKLISKLEIVPSFDLDNFFLMSHKPSKGNCFSRNSGSNVLEIKFAFIWTHPESLALIVDASEPPH